jgi:hypothetical protein
VTYHRRTVPSCGADQADNIAREHVDPISSAARRFVAEIVSSLIRHKHSEAVGQKSRDLIPPAPPKLRETMKEYHKLSVGWARLGNV